MTSATPQAQDRDLILAVDDNEQNLQLLEEYLWQWGYDVVLARDGKEAVEVFPRHSISLVVLDVMMPVMDGFEACARIKATPLGRRVPIVMLTALTGTEDKIRALESGADDFLNKPINREELRTRIRSLLKIKNLRRELDSSENIILTLTTALENKDPKSGGHVQRVSRWSDRLAEKLGLPAADRETIVKGALLHDLGMIGVPDAILKKDTPLTREEHARMRDHTVMGASILSPMLTFAPFVPMVRWHHERWDGTGYPDGLKGEEIPIEARIVGITNRLDDLIHDDKLSEEAALDHIAGETAEGAFDPVISEALRAVVLDEPAKPSSARISSRSSARRPRVLCVDDSRANRDLICATLSETGFDVVTAENGFEAMTRIEDEAIDVMLLDLVMPGQDGQDTLELIRQHPRHEFLPVIVLTAHRNAELRQRAIVAGADDFLSHPLNRLELTTRIRSLLRIRDYHRDLEQTQNIICALALTLEAKDQYTRGHSQRVGDLAFAFSLHLQLPLANAERIRTAGLLHDIGKIAVPEALLNKPGPLSHDEFLQVIDHPVIGEEMCRPLVTLTSVLKLIRHHHERFDGRGYPDGLAGSEIPHDVRLLSIVDAYDALTSHRSYRPAPLTHEAAMETLHREATAGKWDPDMVRSFADMLGKQPPNFTEISRPVPMLQLS